MIRVLLTVGLVAGLLGQQDMDPALRIVVERFFATQAAEDVEGHLALWSRTAQRPPPDQLKFVFDAGDDQFTDLEITRAIVSGDTARVRASVTRARTAHNANPDGTSRTYTSRVQLSLAFVKEDGTWKLVREGSPADELAAALMATSDPATRADMLTAEADIAASRVVDAISRRADQFARSGQYAAGLALYERALEVARALRDRKAEGQMLQNIANSHYFLRDFPNALATYEKRLALEREAANEDGIASALIGIATIRYSTFEYSTALTLYREALAIQEKLDDDALVATTLISTGNVLYLQGDFEGAISDYRRAEGLKRKYHDLGGAAMALEGLGRTYAAQGDYAAALVAFSGVVDEARKRRDTLRLASSLQHIGDTHFRLGNLDSARTAYDESRQHYEKSGDLASVGRVWQASGVTELFAGRLPQAEAAYGKSRDICSRVAPQPDAECVARALVGLAFTQAAQERYDLAIATYRRSIDAFVALKALEAVARAQVGLAEALSGKEDYDAAVVEATNARHAAIALDAGDVLWRALVAQARAERKLGKKAEALGAARAAIAAVKQLAEAALQRPGQAAPRDSSAAFATAAVLHAEEGDPTAAWAAAEQMRAHALRGILAGNEREIARGMTEEERAHERQLTAELTPLWTQRDREKNLLKPDAARLARLDTAIKEATLKRAAWQAELFHRLPELTSWRGLAPAASIEEMRGAVAPGSMVVQFVLDDRDLLVLTAFRASEDSAVEFSAHVVPVKRQAVAERVARAVEPSALADAEGWRGAAADIVKLLPAAVVSQLTSARRIVVVPDDVLWRIPFEALPAGAGYLGDDATVTYAPSVTSLVRAPAARSSDPALRVVIASAPEIASTVLDTLKTTAPSWTLRGADAAAAEAAKVRGALDEATTTLLLKADATEESVRSNAAAASVLHVGAPFRVNAASPLFSSVLLSGADTSPDAPPSRNGRLETREIPNAGVVTRLAVFSDPAALSMRDAASALPAVHWIWRAGGVETVIVRRWAGDEVASSDVLVLFYERLRAGASPADAMKGARNAARNAGASPQAWAGWLVVSGN